MPQTWPFELKAYHVDGAVLILIEICDHLMKGLASEHHGHTLGSTVVTLVDVLNW